MYTPIIARRLYSEPDRLAGACRGPRGLTVEPDLRFVAQAVERSLQVVLFGCCVIGSRVAGDVYRRAHQCEGAREWQRYLQPVPAWKLYVTARDDMKRQYGLARVAGERDRADIRPPRRGCR